MRPPLVLPVLALAACMTGFTDRASHATAERLGLTLADVDLLKSKKGLSDAELLTMPRTALDSLLERLHGVRPDHPSEAEQHRLRSLKNENGEIPHDALMNAKREFEALRATHPLGIAGGFDSTKWTDLGPTNIGGRTRAIAIHPTTHTTIFIGSVAGGIWKTTNGGASWSKVNDLLTNIAITCIVFTPGNPLVMYASTGEGYGNGDGIRGAGIFKSTDGGTTWAQLASTNNANFYWVNRLAFSPNGAVLLAAAGTGMYRSTDAGASFTKVAGTANANCLDVDFHPTNNSLAVAQITDYDFAVPSWFNTSMYTTNGGTSWTVLTGAPRTNAYYDRVELSYHRAWTGAGNGCVYALKNAGGGTNVYRSIDGGASFALVASNSILGSQGWYDNCLWIDPSDADANVADDVVVAGGIDQWRSTNGGTSFTKISTWSSWPTSAHADHHFIVEHPAFNGTTNTTVYFSNDGGIWRTDNVYTVASLSGWVNLNNGYAVTQFYGGSRHAGSGILIGGTQDNGTLRTTTSTSWSTMFGGDGGWCASDPTDSNYHYGEYVYLQIHRSTNGGLSSSFIYGSISGGNFIAPFILDPNNANTMLGGGDSLWRSTNIKAATPAWTSIKATTGSAISAIAVQQGNSNVAWTGHNDGGVYKATNATVAAPTWVPLDNGANPLPNRTVTRITIDPKNPSRVFATFGGFATDNIWVTTNGGTNWSALTGLPSAPVRDLEIHELYGNWLYAATEVGFLVSVNNGVSWTSTATPASVSIDEMFWSGHGLYLVTHGRGMFRQVPYPSPVASVAGVACTVGGPILGPALTSTAPTLGVTLTWTMTGGPAGGSAGLWASVVPGSPFQISPGCFVQLAIGAPWLDFGTKVVNGVGAASWTFLMPDDPSLAGLSVMSQAAAVSGATALLSNGRKLTFGY